MTYSAKSIWYTLQGEGFHTGRPAVFCRFSGCNLWSGREEDRTKGTGACSAWCDTDFVGTDGPGGGRFDADELADRVDAAWTGDDGLRKWCVLTGGEPTLQADAALVAALHRRSFRVAIETNGTARLHRGDFDWVTLSPKVGALLAQPWADELKLAYPQPGAEPARFDVIRADHRYLQPIDGPDREMNTAAAVRYCLDHPAWKLGLQAHKFAGIA